MSKKNSKDDNIQLSSSILDKFRTIDDSEYPKFESLSSPLEKGLWILWVGKEEGGIKCMTAEEIAIIIREVKEYSFEPRSIANAFNRAKGKVHVYRTGERCSYEIMKPGKDMFLDRAKKNILDVFCFEPGKPHSSKKILSEKIFGELSGEIRIVDPYCDLGTLDLVSKIKNQNVKIITRIENLGKANKQDRFKRDIKDFRRENPKFEIRSYPKKEIHDRYIISDDQFTLLGHSIKDLGNKESFAVLLNKESSPDTYNLMVANFNRRWNKSKPL